MATRAALILLMVFTGGCSAGSALFGMSDTSQTFSETGSVIVSKQLPSREAGPVFAFLPSEDTSSFSPAGRIVKTGRIADVRTEDSASVFPVHAYLGSGDLCESEARSSIVITRPVPIKKATEATTGPIFAFIPPAVGFEPASNETWLEIEKETNEVRLKRGETLVKEIKGEGMVDLDPGLYSLQHKQRRPLWYAPDSYFSKRQMAVPGKEDRARYRRGALGQYVLYPTTTFPIHSGPLWTRDVGGLRVSRADLSSIYYMMPIGASIVVK